MERNREMDNKKPMTLTDEATPAKPCVATIGTFDGVHRGHQLVARQVVSQARNRGMEAVVVTFPNHPLQVLRKDFLPQMLTLKEEKGSLLRETGVDKVVMKEFTPAMAQMSARDFMRTVLKEELNVQVLLMGYDNHFGHDRTTFDDYLHLGQELGIEVIRCQELTSSRRISSTTIRQALLQGDIDTATTLLGHSYSLQGLVVKGFQNGRKLGYPTANLQVDPAKLIPENGTYMVSSSCGFGMLNIGTRPTLHNGAQRSIEVHIFDFDGDLYGQTLNIQLLHHLRKEREFANLSALQQQLAADEAHCRSLLTTSSYSHQTPHD